MLVPIDPLPGINTSSSPYAAGKPAGAFENRSVQGRYIDGDKIRFVSGYPEKIGGWVAVSGLTPVVDIPRAQRSWRAGPGDFRVAAGTETHLYQYEPGSDWEDITPLRSISTGTLGATPLTTTNGSAVVAVADASQTLVNGDWVYLSASVDVGGLTILGWYQVSGRSGAGYNITASTTASSSTSGGGTVTYAYPRVTLTDPFTTTNGSATVTVAHTGHGATTGDYAVYDGASAVGGLTLDGEYQLTEIDANSYTITASSAASSGATGGGSVSVVYLVTIGQLTTSAPVPYGVGPYGVGPYGYAQLSTATSVAGWTLAAYGNQMLASPIGGTIYIYDPDTGGRAYPMMNAPTDVLAMFVTPERFVVALGTVAGSLTMAWCDQTDYTIWTASPTNTANEGRTKQGGSTFVGGLPVRDGVSLAVTDRVVFQMNYTGDNVVYETPSISENTGLISPFAIAAQGDAAYWMGDSDFWMWSGTVQRIPSDDIWNSVFNNINKLYLSKCFAYLNRARTEVWFNYVSASSTEIDKYAILHLDQGLCFSLGSWTDLLGSGVRTCGEDSRLFAYPMMMDAEGVLYQHEIGVDDNGFALTAFIEAAPVDASNGSTNIDVFGFIPDFQRLAQNITLVVTTKQYPQDPDTISGPYTITANDTTPIIDLRTDGKMVGWLLASDALGGDFRFGIPRIDIQPSGVRR